MRIEFFSGNYRLDENFKNLVTKKLNKFEKYFNDEAIVKVKTNCLGRDKNTMEISVNSKNTNVRSVVTSANMMGNIDIILPKVERQIVKSRDKFDPKYKKSDSDASEVFDDGNDSAKINGKVVKVKKYNISVTNVENAIEEMELLSHNFYIFVNGDNNKVSVVYKRNDGDYGLIEPEY